MIRTVVVVVVPRISDCRDKVTDTPYLNEGRKEGKRRKEGMLTRKEGWKDGLVGNKNEKNEGRQLTRKEGRRDGRKEGRRGYRPGYWRVGGSVRGRGKSRPPAILSA